MPADYAQHHVRGVGNWRSAVGAASIALLAAAILPPLGLTIVPGGLGLLTAPPTFGLPTTGLVLAPALVGAATIWRGAGTTLTRITTGRRGEQRQAIVRVLLNSALFAYLLVLLAAFPGEEAIAPCAMVGAATSAIGWLVLLHTILVPATSALRRHLAIATDIALLSALLHAGGNLTAVWFPLYLYVAISSGFHYGRSALLYAALLNAAGFAAVFASTPFWRDPALASVALASAVVIPLYAATLIERLRRGLVRTEALSAAKTRLLAAITVDLRRSLDPIVALGATVEGCQVTAQQANALSEARATARAMLLQLDDLRECAEIEAGWWLPEARSFDLHRLVDGAIAAVRPHAAALGIAPSVRFDPRLPYELRGWPQQLRQILVSLICAAVSRAATGKLRIHIDLAERSRDRVTIRVALRAETLRAGDRVDTTAGQAFDRMTASGALGLAVAERLATMMGGRLTGETQSPDGTLRGVELPFAIDDVAYSIPLDLVQHPVLIVAKDTDFAGDLVETLTAWRADARWIGAGEAALGSAVDAASDSRRPVLIVDGRTELLSALSWVHRAVTLQPDRPPHVLLAAGEMRTDTVATLAEDELAAVLPFPLTADLLRNALHSLRLDASNGDLGEAPMPPALSRTGVAEGLPTSPTPADASPSVPMPEIVGSEKLSREPPAPPLHILVAAGSAANRRIIEHILGRGRYVVHPIDAIELVSDALAENVIDLVLLDVPAPGREHYQTIAGWRRAQPGLSVIALVGAVSPEIERRCRDAGIDTVLSKPIEPSQLLGAVEAERRAWKTAPSPSKTRTSSPLVWRRTRRAAVAP